jgi:5-methylcytosine-specific restriction endonuclease McrA
VVRPSPQLGSSVIWRSSDNEDYTGPIVSPKEAKSKGYKSYFTGKRCCHNHLAPRNIGDGCCLRCLYLRNKKWISRPENKEWMRRYNKEKGSSPEGKEWMRQYNREYFSRPHVRERDKLFGSSRRARLKGNGGQITIAEYRAILATQNYRCNNYYCQADISGGKDHMDHIIPITKGGSNDRLNVQGLCSRCNIRKREKDWGQFLDEEYRDTVSTNPQLISPCNL